MLQRTATGTWMPAWVPESTLTLSILLLICSMVQSATNGYDGSMLNGVNMLPAYTDYFTLNSVTKGLNTASVSIGGFFGPLVSGVIADRIGRRPAVFWGSIVTLVGVLLQTAAQNIAMFVVARVVLGLGSAVSGIAGGVYLSETFSSRWRAWGAGLLNDFYYRRGHLRNGPVAVNLGLARALLDPGDLLAPLYLHFALHCSPESPRWLVNQGYLEEARTVVAQTNSNGNLSDPVTLAVYKEIVDTITWEKTERRSMKTMEILKNPVTRKRLLVGMSAGPFSCIAGNVIASYYLAQSSTRPELLGRMTNLKL
ncbi:Sugar and other transporter [Aspergillus sclerotialis]|uniref:Sugar and other transporter n=1 Tax=Aspergillus sclerotialis TaxID=2070753 RepID=A0A3A2ZX07_9EURO|nr:Sugar and other transporter [Aspergillus sclerotialis]